MATTLVVGLIGGVASGKSTVGKLLEARGATLLNADEMAHAALADPAVRAALVERWGSQLIDSDGEIRREEVARRVFGDDSHAVEERRWLEGLLHPQIRRDVESAVAEAKRRGTAAVVVDAPLLLEAGWGELCDELLFVDAPQAVRQERAATRGWTAEEFRSREAAQMPISKKRAAATKVFASVTRDELASQVDAWWRKRVESRGTT